MQTENNIQISRQNISYYNEIAAGYNSLLEKDATNKIIRKIVAEKFINTVKPGWVIDFGGGTGQDLPCLTAYNYDIIFCEPAAGMRMIAKHYRTANPGTNTINFLEGDNTDFRNWEEILPFKQKADGVLANFAVFNCIPDIDRLFINLSQVMNPGGHVIALIMNNRLNRMLRQYFRSTIKSLISGKPLTISISYHSEMQTVYIYSGAAIKKAFEKYFTLQSEEILTGDGFKLLHLVKK